jgi:predicted Fe-Mo cluster-binding NifX family protein
MKLCMPTENEAGLDGTLSSHYGRTPYFTVVDSVTNECVVLTNDRAQHAHGQCGEAAAAFAGQGVEAVVCRGLGRGALTGLLTRGMTVYVTMAPTVAAAVHAFRAGQLTQATLAEACGGGHHHSHAHGHDHTHDHGHG